MVNKKILNYITREWDKRRIACKEVRKKLNIGESNWRKIWKDKEFADDMKILRVKIGITKK
ncbi:hypothetical protein [Clostridium perfringens]|uniref:hypothetical protein n=1 Tax=Clostridium perfringens TaxID=1502 RepID=UPI00096AADA9|nr:hypothetical protein [Clostridium perfringens]